MITKEKKTKIVEEIIKIFNEYPTIGFIDFYNLPTQKYKEIKKKLSEIKIKFFKKSLVIKALERLGKQDLIKYMPNQVGILYSYRNCFEIYREINKLVSYRAAKEGDIAEEDIIIKPMITNIPAGPAISEFQVLKFDVGIEGGKIAIKKEKLLVRKGEKINLKVASILQKLGIRPIKVKLNVLAMYDGKTLYPKEILEMDEKYYIEEILKAFSFANEISKKIGYYTKYNIREFLIRAKTYALYLGRYGNILEKEIVEEFLKISFLKAKTLSEKIRI